MHIEFEWGSSYRPLPNYGWVKFKFSGFWAMVARIATIANNFYIDPIDPVLREKVVQYPNLIVVEDPDYLGIDGLDTHYTILGNEQWCLFLDLLFAATAKN